jgi:ribosomal-protein-alanine N-acetyltransferase
LNMTIAIRPMTGADAPAIHAIRSEPSARRFQPLRQIPFETLAATIAERASLPRDGRLEGKAQWVIDVEGQPAGWISLDVTSREHGVAGIGYTVGESFRGRGVATTATKLLVELAFDPAGLALQRLEAVAAVENLASRRVLLNAGMREEGIARGLLVIAGARIDHMRFGLLRTDVH